MNVLIVDTETTGVNVDKDSICQLALVKVTDEGRGRTLYSGYCRPQHEMGEEAQKVHGITEEMYRWSPHERVALATISMIINAYGPDTILAGHNSSRFDIPLMQRIYPKGPFDKLPHIDTYTLALRMFTNGEGHKLGEVYEHYIGKEPIDAHDAAADCHMVAEILFKFSQDLEMSYQELADYCLEPKELVTWPWGKYKGRKVSELPDSYLDYMTSLTDLPIDIEYTLVKEQERRAA